MGVRVPRPVCLPRSARARASRGKSPHSRVYMRVRAWLARSVATGALSGWVRAQTLADMYTIETGEHTSASYMGHVVRKSYPGIEVRMTQDIIRGLYDRKRNHTEYFFEGRD